MSNLQTGASGQKRAENFLRAKGYKILGVNFRTRYGEIDIIAREGDDLVFVEVKTMQQYSRSGLQPEDQLTKAKLRKTQKTALLYAGHYPKKIDEKRGWRIDLLAIVLKTDLEPEIKHYENIG